MATDLEGQALVRINYARRLAGLPEWPRLVPATPRDPCGCGFQVGLRELDPDVFVWTNYIEVSVGAAPFVTQAFGQRDGQGRYSLQWVGGRVRIRLARGARAFIAAFDRRELDHLIDPVSDAAFQAAQAAKKASVPA